ncbi:MAG: hypothetical protein RR521_12125, partial [Clostridia bacterium]
MRRSLQTYKQQLHNTSIKKKYLFAILLLLFMLMVGGIYTCVQGCRDACSDRIAEAHGNFIDSYESMWRFEQRMLHLVN